MNFSELKQKFPVSFKLFETWVEKNHETSLNIWNGTIRNEDFLFFLDKNGLFISIMFNRTGTGTFYWLINIAKQTIGYAAYQKEDGLPRKDATEAGITKAFELLEQKLITN
jgi:hypothetical protein